jgi:hypothetical protein
MGNTATVEVSTNNIAGDSVVGREDKLKLVLFNTFESLKESFKFMDEFVKSFEELKNREKNMNRDFQKIRNLNNEIKKYNEKLKNDNLLLAREHFLEGERAQNSCIGNLRKTYLVGTRKFPFLKLVKEEDVKIGGGGGGITMPLKYEIGLHTESQLNSLISELFHKFVSDVWFYRSKILNELAFYNNIQNQNDDKLRAEIQRRIGFLSELEKEVYSCWKRNNNIGRCSSCSNRKMGDGVIQTYKCGECLKWMCVKCISGDVSVNYNHVCLTCDSFK